MVKNGENFLIFLEIDKSYSDNTISTYLNNLKIYKDYIEENCIYPVTLTFAKHQIHIKGYLDSGNFATYQGRCIIFLDAKYDTY